MTNERPARAPVFSFSVLCSLFIIAFDSSLRTSEGGRMPFTLSRLQQLIRDTFGAKDARRGVEGTFMWFMEEVGELSAALRNGTDAERAAEFADVLAWLATLANVASVDLEAAVQAKFGRGCPRCGQIPCVCDRAKP
jgi:NTP pyrophosphatase (non-canonical NTP hydrolase)